MSVLRAVLIALATYFVLFALISAAITPERYDIRIGAPASVTILASRDVEDTVTTEMLRDAAAAQVDLSYRSVDRSVTVEVTSLLDRQFSQLVRLSAGDEDALEALSVTLSAEQIEKLKAVHADALEGLFRRAEELARDSLISSLPEGQEAATVARIERDLSAENYDATLVSIAVDVVRACIQPNMLIDHEATELNREKARSLVEPEGRVEGEVIVRQGDIVTLAQYTMLASLGLIADNSLNLIWGVALIVLVLLISVGFYMYRYEHDIWRRPKTLLLLGIIYILVVGLSLLIREINLYAMPVSLGLLLITVLIRPHLALFSNIVLAVMVSLLTSASSGLFTMAMFSIILMSLASGPVVVTVLRKRQQRLSALLAGVMIGVTNFLTTIAVSLTNSADFHTSTLYALWSALGGLFSAVLCIGLQPLMEWMFNLTTSAKLLELSNPNQPLLRRMLLEAPGSYHHSIIVANLAETAATAIGANGLLARVGAYYHDVGKLKRPMYFKENQMGGDNPHTRTDPRVSAAILTAHTRDGGAMGQKARLPEPVPSIIREHHGDSPMMFFYDKAVKLYGGDVDPAAFRYEGPRPHSKEAAVVMLADTIEAAARALPNPDPEKLDQLIRRLVREKMSDGQLDESELTFSDLDRICKAFQSVLSGVFHERIEYPDVPLPPRIEPERAADEPEPERPVAPEAETEDRENAN